MNIRKYICLIAIGLVFWEVGYSQNMNSYLSYYNKNQYPKLIQELAAKYSKNNMNDQELFLLGRSYLKRAIILQDLSSLFDVLGESYYAYRDTSRTATKSIYNDYFLGRFLFENSEYQQSKKYLKRASRNHLLPVFYRARAKLWLAASDYELGEKMRAARLWESLVGKGKLLKAELLYAKSEIGLQVEQPPVIQSARSVISKRMAIWSFSRCKNYKKMIPIKEKLFSNPRADVLQKVLKGRQVVHIPFYDPATLKILSYSDFVSALDAFSRIHSSKDSRHNFYAGVCAYNIKDFKTARKYFLTTSTFRRNTYLGAIAYQSGNPAEAKTYWAKVVHAHNMNYSLEWVNVVSGLDKKSALLVANEYFSKTLNMPQSLLLGRGYLKMGKIEKALKVLEKAYPNEYNNQIEYIEPSYLIVIAHVKHLTGRKYYAQVLYHITSLKEEYPIALPVIDVAQLFYGQEGIIEKYAN